MARFMRLEAVNTLLDVGFVPLFYNGDVETIADIKPEDQLILVRFPEGTIEYDFADCLALGTDTHAMKQTAVFQG